MAVDLQADPTFLDRADALINLANGQCGKVGRGNVSASFLYAAARFQAFNAACWVNSAEELQARRSETLDYFVAQYRNMLVEHLEDYAHNFSRYVGGKDEA